MEKITLAIVDDNTEMAEFLKELLSSFPRIAHIDIFPDGQEFIDQFNQLKPDVVLMDLELPGRSGAEVIQHMRALDSHTNYIAFTVFGDDQNVFRALRAGAKGYILKTETYDKIYEAIELVLSGGSPMTPAISRMVIEYFQKQHEQKPLEELTKRECNILDLLAEGKKYKEIADLLFISVDTVRTHIRNIYIKLEVDNKTSAINKYRK